MTSCPSGYYPALISSTVFNNTNYYQCMPCLSPCLTCETDGVSCTSCISNYSLSGSSCQILCPDGKYASVSVTLSVHGLSIQLSHCVPCTSSCLTCSSLHNCTSCPSGMVLDSAGFCNSNCTNPNTYLNSSTRQCDLCSTTCYTCIGPQSSNCISCVPPLQLYLGNCMSVCPFGFYATSSYTCQPCNPNCADCSNSATNCTVCPQGVFLHTVSPGAMICTVECGSGFFLDLANNICQNCDTSCTTCSGPATTQCSTCPSGFVLWQGQCLSSCPSGTAKVIGVSQDIC